jgi:sugar lactone lactonase YvrE
MNMFHWIAVATILTMIPRATLAQQPPATQAGSDPAQLQSILIPGEEWRIAASGMRSTDGPAVNSKGEIFFNDGRSNKTLKIGLDGKVTDFIADSHHGAGQAFGPDGRLYAVAPGVNQIIAYDVDAKPTVIAEDLHGNDIVVGADGGMYVTISPTHPGEIGKVWYISPRGEKQLVDPNFSFPNGLALSPDQTLLYVGDYRSHWVYSYKIQPDGSLGPKHQFCDLYVPPTAPDSAADGMRVDRDGRLYVTTRSGIQVCDPAGRMIGIIPTLGARVSNLSFGGPDFDMLFATCGDKVYQRKVKAHGALSNQPPITPATQK